MFKITKNSTIFFLVLLTFFTLLMAYQTFNAVANGSYGWALLSGLLTLWNGSGAVENYKRLKDFK